MLGSELSGQSHCASGGGRASSRLLSSDLGLSFVWVAGLQDDAPRVLCCRVPKQVCGTLSPFLLQKAVLRKTRVGTYVETAPRETKAGIFCDGPRVLATVSMPTVCQGSFYLLLPPLFFNQRTIWGLDFFHFIGEGN